MAKVKKSKQKIKLSRGYVLMSLFILIIAAAIYFAVQPAQVLYTEEFSCPGYTGFNFSYPVFKDWIALGWYTHEGPCDILLSEDALKAHGINDNYTIPFFEIKKENITYAEVADKSALLQNPNGIYYEYFFIDYNGFGKNYGAKYAYMVQFYSDNYSVSVSLNNVPDNWGFSTELFWQKVVNSFRFNPQ